MQERIEGKSIDKGIQRDINSDDAQDGCDAQDGRDRSGGEKLNSIFNCLTRVRRLAVHEMRRNRDAALLNSISLRRYNDDIHFICINLPQMRQRGGRVSLASENSFGAG